MLARREFTPIKREPDAIKFRQVGDRLFRISGANVSDATPFDNEVYQKRKQEDRRLNIQNMEVMAQQLAAKSDILKAHEMGRATDVAKEQLGFEREKFGVETGENRSEKGMYAAMLYNKFGNDAPPEVKSMLLSMMGIKPSIPQPMAEDMRSIAPSPLAPMNESSLTPQQASYPQAPFNDTVESIYKRMLQGNRRTPATRFMQFGNDELSQYGS